LWQKLIDKILFRVYEIKVLQTRKMSKVHINVHLSQLPQLMAIRPIPASV